MITLRFGVIGAVAFAAASMTSITAQAAPVDLLPGNNSLGIYLKDFPPNLNESQIFLQNNNGTTVFGNVGSQNGLPVVNFTSTSTLDPANGFANIKDAGGGTYANLTVTIPGYGFGDLLFDTQINDVNNLVNLTIAAYNGVNLLGSLTLNGDPLKKSADQSWLVLAEGNAIITSVLLTSTTGFNETKHFQVSELQTVTCTDGSCVPNPGPGETPIPGAAFLMGSVLAGGAGFGAWRRRRREKFVA